MQTIATKYHGPTDHRGSRITATASGGFRQTTAYDDALPSERNHATACARLRILLGWSGVYYGGHTKDGMVWLTPDDGLVIRAD